MALQRLFKFLCPLTRHWVVALIDEFLLECFKAGSSGASMRWSLRVEKSSQAGVYCGFSSFCLFTCGA